MQLARFGLNQLVAEVAELYRLQDPGIEIAAGAGPAAAARSRPTGAGCARFSPTCSATPSRPWAAYGGAAITVRTRWVLTARPRRRKSPCSDNGPGFREDILGQAFEPYVTSKAAGTGWGWRS